ncbi:hypothetical protein EYF80_057094 [Liparis tanakae]|uniref:Uncharacterized protein n=1 Tax=Liparis tanakae TaxID=230148 RepID=A0A4Z2EVC8_9TELE|nr:hypothetical protein EYF80_057094 [Liparis tanakae]
MATINDPAPPAESVFTPHPFSLRHAVSFRFHSFFIDLSASRFSDWTQNHVRLVFDEPVGSRVSWSRLQERSNPMDYAYPRERSVSEAMQFKVRGRRTEDKGWRTEDGGQRTEEGGQRTEDGGQRTEDGGRRFSSPEALSG